MSILTCLVTLVILCGVRAQEDIIRCQNEDDYYHLLYNTCLQAKVCKLLFHLYPLREESDVGNTAERTAFIDYRNKRDYQLFRDQLSKSLIFQQDSTGLLLTGAVPDERRLVLQNLIPSVWLPTTIVNFNLSQPVLCSETDLPPQQALHALYALHLYKTTVSDEFFCHDPNERLLIDPVTETAYCICKKEKICNNESNYNHLLIMLMIILIFSMFIVGVFSIAGIFYKQYQLTEL